VRGRDSVALGLTDRALDLLQRLTLLEPIKHLLAAGLDAEGKEATV